MTDLVEKARKTRAAFDMGSKAKNDTFAPRPGEKVLSVSPDLVDANPFQYRKSFDGLDELAEDIKKNGQLQPCVVRLREGRYQIVAGERRLRACRLAQVEVLIIVREYTDVQAAILCQVENQSRQDTSAIEDYYGIKMLKVNFNMGINEILEERKISRTSLWRINAFDDVPESVLECLLESPLRAIFVTRDAQFMGDVFKNNFDHTDEMAEKLISLIGDLSIKFHSPSDKNVNKAKEDMFVFFSKWVQNKYAKKDEKTQSVSYKAEKEPLVIDGCSVGTILEGTKKLSLEIKKEDMPQDKYREFKTLILDFFANNKEVQE